MFAWSYKPLSSHCAEALRLSAAGVDGYRETADAPVQKVHALREAVSEHQEAMRRRWGGPRRADRALYRRVRETLTTV